MCVFDVRMQTIDFVAGDVIWVCCLRISSYQANKTRVSQCSIRNIHSSRDHRQQGLGHMLSFCRFFKRSESSTGFFTVINSKRTFIFCRSFMGRDFGVDREHTFIFRNHQALRCRAAHIHRFALCSSFHESAAADLLDRWRTWSWPW